MDGNAPRRRRFQISVRLLLIGVAVSAVAFWVYWFGWPRWQLYREQAEFEESVRALKAGMSVEEATKLVRWNRKVKRYTQAFDSKENSVVLAWYPWRNAIYCIYYVEAKSDGSSMKVPCVSIEVFRIPPVPREYTAKTDGGIYSVTKRIPPPASEEIPSVGYFGDFLEVISGDRGDSYGLEYSVIHADFAPQELDRK
jgi:hypothetical protein